MAGRFNRRLGLGVLGLGVPGLGVPGLGVGRFGVPGLGVPGLGVLGLGVGRFGVLGPRTLVIHAVDRARGPDIIGPQADQIGQVSFGQRLGEGDHALRRFRALDLLDLALAHKPHWDVVGPSQRLDLPQDRGRIRTLHHPDLVHRPPACGK